jgi:hypothetical protein
VRTVKNMFDEIYTNYEKKYQYPSQIKLNEQWFYDNIALVDVNKVKTFYGYPVVFDNNIKDYELIY